MKVKWQKYAPIGLALALLAAVSASVLYIIQREWNIYLQVSLGMILVGLALFALLDPGRVLRALTGRQMRYGSNAVIMFLAFTGIVVVINYLGYKNSKRWDLSEDQRNTLATETIETLKSLPEPVTALAFFTPRVSSESARKLLEQYKFDGKGKFDYRFIDPEADPIAAQNAKVTRDGTVVLKMGDRYEPVSFVSEEELTGALVRLISNEVRAVYFLSGHGERAFDSGADSYSQAKQVLESKNYKVETLNLLATNTIPQDAKVIVIAGPKKPVSQAEVDKLDEYLKGGGSLLVMEEPLPVTDFGEEADPLADYLEKAWGIKLGRDIVVDLGSQQPFVAVANAYANHVITEKLLGMVTFFPTARSVTISNQVENVQANELIFTSDQAWAETNFEGLKNQSASPDAGQDQIGRVPLAVAAEGQSNNARLVVFGDADFGSDQNFTRYGNGDILVNAVDWASKQENLINLTPKPNVQRVLVPPQRYTMGMILFTSVFLLPAVVLVGGGLVWYRRRQRG